MNLVDYEREGLATYGAFAATVAAILTAAISAEGGYRLQQVNNRAKQPGSLRKKLQDRGIEATTTLESDIKDLAGCRVVFYTNSDVTRLINSGLIQQNFEVLESKLHHPRLDSAEAADLYISNHYLVTLLSDRVALPEYSGFAGMRCEIQVQTILNHAWAEMAHDTIYKAPELGNFGGKAFDTIGRRLQKVARKYLLPAGYEFQKIAYDFQRLVQGKALFDGDALEAIVNAPDNNARAEALETFTENVLPFYDDLPAVYPEIVSRLMVAADVARAVQPVAIATPYGAFSGKTYGDVLKAIANILTVNRYLSIEITFDALRTLYGWATDEGERKPLLALGKTLAEHQLDVWRKYGPAAQAIVIDRIEALNNDERLSLTKLLTAMLREVLGLEVSGSTSSSTAVTLHRGTVAASDLLRATRRKAIDLLKHQFGLVESDIDRQEVLLTLQAATQRASGAGNSNALAKTVMDDTCSVIAFETEIASTLSLQLLQAVETRIHRCYQRYEELPPTMRDDASLIEGQKEVRAAALAFRDKVNANEDFLIYKTLVGFDCVYPPAWGDKNFGYGEAEGYRKEQVDNLLATVNADTAEIWFDRVSRYARTESNDAATFPVFGKFLERLAEQQPAIALDYIDRLDGPLKSFLPGMLGGLMKSIECTQALALMARWLNEGLHIHSIAWYLRFAESFDEVLLCRALESAIKHDDAHGVRNALIAAVQQFEKHPGVLIEKVFLPAVRWTAGRQDFGWLRMQWFSWMNQPIIRALDEMQASNVLEALIPYPDMEYASEDIAGSIAERWPALVVVFFGLRQAFARTDDAPSDYDAIPFAVHQLKEPLAAAPDLMLAGARQWFDFDPLHFSYVGARLLASVCPELTDGLDERLAELIAAGDDETLAFVLAVLSAFEGKPCVYELVRSVVALLDSSSPLLERARSVLYESGVISGAFGAAQLYAERKARLEPWLADERQEVRAFAADLIRDFDQYIAGEVRSAEASVALRKLNHGEELDDSETRTL